MGNQTSVTDASGYTTSYLYDDLYRVSRILANDRTLRKQFVYETGVNAVTEEDGQRRATRYEYNAFDQLIRVTDALGEITSYSYDANSNLTAKGNEWVEHANSTAEIIKDTRSADYWEL